MSLWRSPPAARHDDIRISAIRVAFAVSLLVHALALVSFLPHLRNLAPSANQEGKTGSMLAVDLTPMPKQPGGNPETAPPPETRVAIQQPPPRSAMRPPPPPPPMMTAPRRTPDAPALPRTPPPQPIAPPQPPGVTDLAAYVEARRRARGEAPTSPPSSPSTQPSDDEDARQRRIIAANIGMGGQPTFGKDAKNGGGIFQIKTMEYNFAEFYFFGWNKDISRRSKQVIEVRKGDNPDIRIAVIRRMIAIIRENVTEDFSWESNRLGREVRLSARARDTAGLEAFMMREFDFDTVNPP